MASHRERTRNELIFYKWSSIKRLDELSLAMLAILLFSLTTKAIAQRVDPSMIAQPSLIDDPLTEVVTVPILPPTHLRPNVNINLHDWTRRLSDEIHAVSNKTLCLSTIERFYDSKADFQPVDGANIRDKVIIQIENLLVQHRAAVNAIVNEAEKLAVAHTFVKNLKVNYTDVHRIRNELDINNNQNQPTDLSQTIQQSNDQLSLGVSSTTASGQTFQFTSINGGTPVPGPAEWQTPIKNIVMQVNKNFGDLPVNTSMSAVHLPLPIYAGLPEIMNGIAWTERLDNVFKRNLANHLHVHHQYYGDHLGFMRTFPAHRWRIPRTEPDLFDARTRPWYVVGASSPKDVVILVDTSGSMTGLRREIAKGVVFEILDTLSYGDHFSIMRFSESVTPIGFPKCNLKTPKLVPALEQYCTEHQDHECRELERQKYRHGNYLRDNPIFQTFKNGTYLNDEMYWKSIHNVSNEINDAYLLPATSRNIRYLKSNFSMPTAGIANFTNALMAAFELLNAYNRTQDQGAQCNQAIFLITDGAIKSHQDIFNRYNYPNAPVRVFTYMIGREVGDIRPTKAMACNNRGYYTHVINLSEVREQVQKYLPVMARPLVLSHHHPTSWTNAYGDETYQVLTDWVLETKRRERARIMLNEERERMNESLADVINIELTSIPEYDEIPLVDEELKNRSICDEDPEDQNALEQALGAELDPLGYNDLACHWTNRRADLLISAVRPVFDNRNTTLYFQRVLYKKIWTEQETQVRNAQLLGVAAVDLRIADILRAVPSHLLGPNGYTILMGHNGFIMNHPELRALLEDPFDKQSKILKPFFGAVDLTHLEQLYPTNETDQVSKRIAEKRLHQLRDSLIRQKSGLETITVKQTIDCKKRPIIKSQTFYYGKIKETPFSFVVSLPLDYGHNRVVAKMDLKHFNSAFLKPSDYDLWTVHPDYKYCEGSSLSKNSSASTILEVLEAARDSSGTIQLDNLRALNETADKQLDGRGIVCDRELFPSLLFDAAATYQQSESFCCDRPSGFSSYYSSDQSCSQNPEDMRSKMVNIHGLEMSFLATQNGLTRVKVFDLTPRIKKLADIFIQRHNKAVEEPWYARTVNWNMRFDDDAALITVPFNAYVRLIAKLRQRITQRHPAVNDTRTNCDPNLDSNLYETSSTTTQITFSEENATASLMADEPSSSPEVSSTEQPAPLFEPINYHEYSAYDFLDLLTNSSVHISVTQTALAGRGKKSRLPVAVSGLLFDYATFARRFLNSTSLNIRTSNSPNDDSTNLPASQPNVKVEICPGNSCPNKCGYRNDTIDCLLVDNNGYIVVGEELPLIGRHLNDYDDRLMQSLVEKRVYHTVVINDYQAICTRNDQPDPRAMTAASTSQQSSSSTLSAPSNPFRLSLAQAFLSNLASSFSWFWSTIYMLLIHQTLLPDLAQQMQWQRSVVDAQSSIANQSLLALLPNKTYLRPCERNLTLYETRLNKKIKLTDDTPEYFVTKCGCSGWYVYDQVPKTNLIMLVVNTTSACRRCDLGQSNFVPSIPDQNSPLSMIAAVNKTAEEQVCNMLEHDIPLYKHRHLHCYAYDPGELQINLCGRAFVLEPIYKLSLLVSLTTASILIMRDQIVSTKLYLSTSKYVYV